MSLFPVSPFMLAVSAVRAIAQTEGAVEDLGCLGASGYSFTPQRAEYRRRACKLGDGDELLCKSKRTGENGRRSTIRATEAEWKQQ